MNAWLKRSNGPNEVVRVAMDAEDNDAPLAYHLYKAYESEYLGRILFDANGYWIYDGEELTVDEQEQLARVIRLWNN